MDSKPTQKQWREDVQNTRNEVLAYADIAGGYEVLSNLPEHQNTSNGLYYRNQRSKHESLRRRCNVVLKQMLDWGEAQGYKEEVQGVM